MSETGELDGAGAVGGSGVGDDSGAMGAADLTLDANRNQLWARALIQELVRSGVTDLCLAPGSRSTALVLAASRASDVGDLKVRVFIDERSAGFFALGLGRASGRPAAVVTTSGTAVANLLPSVVEADRSEVPLLLLTADRPRHLRDADANQSIDQVGIFGSRTRAAWDLAHPVVEPAALRHLRGVACRAVAAARGAPAGPVHLNVPFAKPLEGKVVESDQRAMAACLGDDRAMEGLGGTDVEAITGRPDGAPWVTLFPRRTAPDPGALDRLAELLESAKRPLLIAGHLPGGSRAADAVIRAAAAHGAPLLADPLSGARFGASHGATRIAAYDTLLRAGPAAKEGATGRAAADVGAADAKAASVGATGAAGVTGGAASGALQDTLRPDLVVRFGRGATSAALQSWLEGLRDVTQVVVDDGALWKDHAGLAHHYLQADPEQVAEGLLARGPTPADVGWRSCWERAEEAAVGALAAPDSAELRIAKTVLEGLPGGTPLFASSSMPIRDLDTVAAQREDLIPVFGNRGASGIDGIVSSALGVAAASGLPTVCLLGDLALLHDANGLAAHREAEVVFVLVNNDGGGIFHMLPIAEQDPPFTELFATPHGRDFAKLAGFYDLPHRVVGVGGLAGALGEALGAGGSRILELRTDRTTEPAARDRDRQRALAAAHAVVESEGNEADSGDSG